MESSLLWLQTVFTMIKSSKDKVDVLLNSKSEWHGSAVTRVTTERDGDDSSSTTRRRGRPGR